MNISPFSDRHATDSLLLLITLTIINIFCKFDVKRHIGWTIKSIKIYCMVLSLEFSIFHKITSPSSDNVAILLVPIAILMMLWSKILNIALFLILVPSYKCKINKTHL